jgi:sterol desaturase/sphingolipid hydroxylase (fatty acid hydroxylase superfamily)
MLDVKLLLMNRLLGPSTLLARLLLGPLSVTWVATMTQSALLGLGGAGHEPAAWSTATLAVFVLATALVDDFATYVVHALHHRWPLLWEFHKVHHSAEVLTPLTVYRKHPVYNLLSRVTNIAIVGPFQGLIAALFAGPADPVTLFGANVVFSLFHLLGANLRHSHVWLSFGPRLSHVFISPAQHQIHHSKAPQHWDKNFGEVFALWDWMFGTLYVPGREREALEFGVAGDAGQEHATLWQAYFVPFANCGELLRGHVSRLLPAPSARPRSAVPPA